MPSGVLHEGGRDDIKAKAPAWWDECRPLPLFLITECATLLFVHYCASALKLIKLQIEYRSDAIVIVSIYIAQVLIMDLDDKFDARPSVDESFVLSLGPDGLAAYPGNDGYKDKDPKFLWRLEATQSENLVLLTNAESGTHLFIGQEKGEPVVKSTRVSERLWPSTSEWPLMLKKPSSESLKLVTQDHRDLTKIDSSNLGRRALHPYGDSKALYRKNTLSSRVSSGIQSIKRAPRSGAPPENSQRPSSIGETGIMRRLVLSFCSCDHR